MKKGYYIHFEGRQSIGVSKKMDMQLDEFRQHYLIEEINISYVKRNLAERLIGLFPSASISREYEKALDNIKDPDFIYARRTVCDRKYLRFWKTIKERYPNCKIIIEIFTYPYDKDDFAKWNAWPFLVKEWIYRPRLKKYIDRFVTYSSDKEIFGIPTFVTSNGIIVDDVRELAGKAVPGIIRLIGVAYMQRQHGYERVIEGMADYYRSGKTGYDITLKLVGDGPEKDRYKELVSRYGLADKDKVYDTTVGDELDDLYDDSDIGLAVFGMYKVGYKESVGAIKTRECFAKGIPMISGSPITWVDEDNEYVEIFDNSPEAVDMQRVISLYERVFGEGRDRKKTSDTMREYAQKNFSMKRALAPIIEFIG